MIPTSYFYRDLYERHWFGAETPRGSDEAVSKRRGWIGHASDVLRSLIASFRRGVAGNGAVTHLQHR